MLTSAKAKAIRVCVVSDDLSGPPDEGVKKFTWELARALSKMADTRLISTNGPVELPDVVHVPARKTFLSWRLWRHLRAFDPDVVIYASRGSATFFSFLRATLLHLYHDRSKLLMFALQTRRHPRWQQAIIRVLPHMLMCVQSGANEEYLRSLGLECILLPSGIDGNVFVPVSEEERKALRERYGLRWDVPLVLHVGHLARGRGVTLLGEVARLGMQAVLVASSSTERDEQLRAELSDAGVQVITQYVPHVEHFYQMSDCYLFPVKSTDNSVEVPLSVLEAMACDLPVVSTRFGGLEYMFGMGRHSGIQFCDSEDKLLEAVQHMVGINPRGNRQLVAPYTWEAIASRLLQQCMGEGWLPEPEINRAGQEATVRS